ncbi:MAG: UbiA family prenyltransferase, partial [Chitinophagaceae bacterium]
AYLAVTDYFSVLPILFSVVVISWVSGFDVIYALQDEEFDRSQGLHSLPVRLGRARALSMSWFLHLASMTGVIIIGFTGGFGGFYWAGAVFFAVMLFYQHSLVSPQDLSKVNLAFMTTNGLASIVYASLVIIDVISR